MRYIDTTDDAAPAPVFTTGTSGTHVFRCPCKPPGATEPTSMYINRGGGDDSTELELRDAPILESSKGLARANCKLYNIITQNVVLIEQTGNASPPTHLLSIL